MKDKQDLEWWTSEEPHEQAWAAYTLINENDQPRQEAYKLFLSMYGNMYGARFSNDLGPLFTERVTLNVCKSVVDTVASKIAKSKPKAAFLTSAGNYTLKRKAKLLERYVDSQFYLAKIPPKMQDAFIDALCFGTGVVKFYPDVDTKQTGVDRVYPGEILVDATEGMYRTPRQMFQKKYISREQLLTMFPDSTKEIEAAPEIQNEEGWGQDSTADQLVVVEAWHLPSSSDATDGRHIICIDGHTLHDEKWTQPDFPFVFLRWNTRRRGFWGQGLVEDLAGIQIEINRLLQKIQKVFHLLAVPRIYVEQGSKINKAYFNNMIGCVVPYVGVKPDISTQQTIHPEIFNHLERLYAKAYEIAGISQDTAAGAVPSGLDEASGIALLRYSESQTTRFALAVQAWEEAHCEAARMVVSCGKQLSKLVRSYSPVTSKDRNTIATVKWNEVDMAEDAYVLKVFPASSLPDLPSGRIKMLLSMQQLGLIKDQASVARLLDFPDLEGDFALDRAASEDIDRQIELMLDDGRFEPPEPFQDLFLALKKVQSAYLKARCDGVPEDRLELLREYMSICQNMIMASQPQQAPLPNEAGIPPSLTAAQGVAPTAPTGNEVM